MRARVTAASTISKHLVCSNIIVLNSFILIIIISVPVPKPAVPLPVPEPAPAEPVPEPAKPSPQVLQAVDLLVAKNRTAHHTDKLHAQGNIIYVIPLITYLSYFRVLRRT